METLLLRAVLTLLGERSEDTISSSGAGLQPKTTERKGTTYQAITSGFKCDGQGLLPWLASFSAPFKGVQSGNLPAIKCKKISLVMFYRLESLFFFQIFYLKSLSALKELVIQFNKLNKFK